MLIYLGRYARQDAVAISDRLPMRDVLSWVDRTHELLEQERRNSQAR